ncbi:MAG: IS1 family transposase [Spirochaetaceae bacterium]|nr:IS1 family transposase [Spirochaetaceae bacterium]
MDETRSFAGGKSRQRRLWRAADHKTGEPPAFHFGTREYKNLSGRLRLLKPYEIKAVYSDDHFACKSRVTESEAVTGKQNTQKTERKRLSLRTWCSRLARKGTRFFKDPRMRNIAVALVINFWFFHKIVW